MHCPASLVSLGLPLDHWPCLSHGFPGSQCLDQLIPLMCPVSLLPMCQCPSVLSRLCCQACVDTGQLRGCDSPSLFHPHLCQKMETKTQKGLSSNVLSAGQWGRTRIWTQFQLTPPVASPGSTPCLSPHLISAHQNPATLQGPTWRGQTQFRPCLHSFTHPSMHSSQVSGVHHHVRHLSSQWDTLRLKSRLWALVLQVHLG
jgi:hypothetical protein